MKLVKVGLSHIKWPQRIVCPKCESTLEVSKADARQSRDKKVVADCLVCKKTVIIWRESTASKPATRATPRPQDKANSTANKATSRAPLTENRYVAASRKRKPEVVINGELQCEGGCDTITGGCVWHSGC